MVYRGRPQVDSRIRSSTLKYPNSMTDNFIFHNMKIYNIAHLSPVRLCIQVRRKTLQKISLSQS